MLTAKNTLEKISEDPEARRLARDREDAIKFYKMEMEMNRQEGRAEGEARGRAEGLVEGETRGKRDFLLKLLQTRFTPLPDTAIATLQDASSEQLDVWVTRVLTAQTLEKVFR